MNILHYCPHFGGVMYEWHYVHFIDELQKNGHQVTDCNPIRILGRKGNKGEYSDILVDFAKQVLCKPGPHMLLAASATDKNLEPAAIDHIRDLGMLCVNLSVDDIVAPYRFREIGSHFDLHWTTFIGTQQVLERYGCRVAYLPMAANPWFFKRDQNVPLRALAFVGSCYGIRKDYILRLARAGIPLKVRGGRWLPINFTKSAQGSSKWLVDIDKVKTALNLIKHTTGRKVLIGGFLSKMHFGMSFRTSNEDVLDSDNLNLGGEVSLNETVSLYASCVASLGILEVANTYTLKRPVIQYRLRDFETTMIGCAHIVRRVPELEQSFLENQEIIFYDSLDECVEKAHYYLHPNHYDLCVKIGKNARKRAEQEHSWICRFSEIWQLLGIQ